MPLTAEAPAIQGSITITNEPILSSDALTYYYDRLDEFIDDNIIWPAKKFIPNLEMAPDQRKAAVSVSRYPRTGIESGHGAGKSAVFAWIGIAYLCTRYNSLGMPVKVPCIAPTYHQLYDVLWPEMKRWLAMSRLRPLLTINQHEMWYNGAKDGCFARTRSVSKSDNLQGFHAPHLLWIADEAFGITKTDIWETVEGSLTEDDNRIIFGGQHTVITGYCHDAFHKDRDSWSHPAGCLLRFNSEKSPLAKPEFSLRIARKYGKNSDVYRVRVLGEEPKGNPNAFIQLADVEEARNREIEGSGVIEMGVDCARFGDDLFCVTTRWGNHVYPQFTLPLSDTYQMYDATLQELRKYRKETGYAGTVRIKIDNTGGYGAGLVDMLLRNRSDNIEVIPITFGAGGDEEYHDNIAMMWGEAREIMPYLEIEDYDGVEFLTEELSTRRYYLDSNGLIHIETKEDYKKDYEASPDRADSFVLCVSQKAAPKRVFPYYHSTNPNQHKAFSIAWDKVETNASQVYAVLILEKNLGLYGGLYFWGRQTKVLRQYAEICQHNPTPQTIAVELKQKAGCNLRDAKTGYPFLNRILGNEAMFDRKRDIPYHLNKEKIKITKAGNYNIGGALAFANTMFTENRIILHQECEEANRQWERWAIQNGKPTTGFPMCEALMVVVSDLKEQGEMKEPVPLLPYSKRKQEIRQKLYNREFEKVTVSPKTKQFSNEYTW